MHVSNTLLFDLILKNHDMIAKIISLTTIQMYNSYLLNMTVINCTLMNIKERNLNGIYKI